MEFLDSKSLVMKQIGVCSSVLYERIANGLFPRPVKIGRASRWPRSDVQVIVAAMVAGHSDGKIRELVTELHAQRYSKPIDDGASFCTCADSERRIAEISLRASPQIMPSLEALRVANQRVHRREHLLRSGESA